MSTLDQAMNYLADHVNKNLTVKSLDTNIGVVAARGTKWITLNKPAGALCPVGFYIYNSINTWMRIYSLTPTSLAVSNDASSASASNLTITVYWLCYK